MRWAARSKRPAGAARLTGVLADDRGLGDDGAQLAEDLTVPPAFRDPLGQDLKSGFWLPGLAVGAVARQRIEDVGDGHASAASA